MTCMVIGDSLAVGVGHLMAGCTVKAHVGATSTAILGFTPHQLTEDLVVISAGANDGAYTPTLHNLFYMRDQIGAHKVVWLLPARPEKSREIIKFVSSMFGDALLDTAPLAGPDRLHPTAQGYRYISNYLLQLATNKL